jgi:hypothetical protein
MLVSKLHNSLAQVWDFQQLGEASQSFRCAAPSRWYSRDELCIALRDQQADCLEELILEH